MLTLAIRHVQHNHFQHEIDALETSQSMDRGSVLRNYCCIIDSDGILRLETRLRPTGILSMNQVRPIIRTTTRAVHLETINGLTSKMVFQALRRFIARRGPPRLIYSDNGSQLILIKLGYYWHGNSFHQSKTGKPGNTFLIISKPSSSQGMARLIIISIAS